MRQALLELAGAGGDSPSTFRDFESERRVRIARDLTVILAALQSADLTFISQNDNGAGVGLRDRA
jgi:hypothetical protein